MSTLSDMATLVTTELGVYDDTSQALARVYLAKNYIQVWDKYPWRDVMGWVAVAVPAGQGYIAYPTGMDRIVTVRASQSGQAESPPPVPPGFPDMPDSPAEPDDPTVPVVVSVDSRFIDPVNSTFIIESEPTLFEKRGFVRSYEETHWTGGRQVRFYPIPSTGTTFLFFGKLKCPGFLADTDEPIIRNIEPALIDYATADMLRRQRQYGKADLRMKSAQEHEASAWNVEQQQANQPRRTKTVSVTGNTLVEMTDAVCTICGQWTPEYRNIIGEFLRRNYQTMYDSFLWPESVVSVRVPYTTAIGAVIMPEYIDKVLAVRGNSNLRLSPVDPMLIMDISPEMFTEFGEPVKYIITTPVGVSVLPSATTKLVFASTSSLDTSPIMIRGEIYVTGTQIEEVIQLNGTTPVTSFYSYDVPITVAKDTTYGNVTVNAAVDGRLLVQLISYQRESKHQRLALYPLSDTASLAPGEVFHVLVLGKRFIRPLLVDQDSPTITGAQAVLIAGAASDVFRKLGQADQAAAFQQKAGASMEILKAKNTDQGAHAPRFVPEIEPRSYTEACAW